MSTHPTWDADDWDASAPTVLGSVARHRYAVLLATVATAVLGFVGSSLMPPVYTGVANVYLTEQEDAFNPDRPVQEAASRIASRAVLRRAARSLDGVDRRTLEDAIDVTADTGVGLLAVSAESRDAEQAAAMANAVARSYEQLTMEAVQTQLDEVDDLVSSQQSALVQQIERARRRVEQDPTDAQAQRELDALQGQLLAIQNRIGEVVADTAVFGTGIDEIERAVVPDEPTRPRPVRNAAIVGLAGLAGAVAMAYWRELRTARARTDPADVLGAPLLAQIPEFTRSVDGRDSDPLFDYDAVEAYQFLLSSFEFAVNQTGARSILVTSPSPGDGKSLTSLHLARALATQGRQVTLVDADIRARGLTAMLNAEHLPGLVALAEGELVDTVTRRYRISPAVRLSFVPAGRALHQPTGLLATSTYREAISKITQHNELTVVDGAPLLTVADALAIATQVEGILLVIDAQTSQSDLEQVRQRLGLVSTPLLGFVVNRVQRRAAVPTSYVQDQGPTEP